MALKLNKSMGIVLFVLLAFLLSPTPGWSQPKGAEQQSKKSKISDDEIASFAKVQNQIAKLRQEYQAKLSDEKDTEKQEKIYKEMNEKSISAAGQEGFSVERYNEIFNAAQNDPPLQHRIQEAIKKSMQ
jgi:poly-D-alanine transfer protein DltD